MSQYRSAFEAIPGRDALLEYEPKVYLEKEYVERNGLIYKSIVSATSNTFIDAQWELIADLREIRVANIAARNALTGNTGTTLLDNTNVLVLNAIADPNVGTADFARYNYNQGTASWLLLQIGVGNETTGSTIVDYSTILNRPSVVSGVTVNAGAGLTGGGSIFGTIPQAGGAVTINHADTSSQASLTPTGLTYAQQLKFDTFGHVTGATTSTWVHPDTSSQGNVLNTGRTYIQSISLDGDGHLIGMSSSVWSHPDTSNQGNVINIGNAYIQSIYLDGDGHVVGIDTGTISGGGVGYAVRVNGNNGGVLTVASGGTITVSGGTNITTTRTGNASNPGIRVDFSPAGANGQVQYNNSGFLGASSNFVFSASTSTLRSSNFLIGVAPSTGATTDQFITRNPTTGLLQRLNLATIARALSGGNLNNIQYKTANGFGGASDFYYDPAAGAVTLGSRSVGATGTTSLAAGIGNIASGNRSIAHGSQNIASGVDSFASGSFNRATGSQSHAEGIQTSATTFYAHSEGFTTLASGQASHAAGTSTIASGNNSHSAGSGVATKEVLASGLASFNHSSNNGAQIVGHGALALQSAILGGLNHNIEIGNTNAVIIGGNTIKLTGTSYIDHTAIANLAIMSIPTLGVAADDVLVRNATTGRIRRVTQASLAGGGGGTPAGANTQVQFNNLGAFGASANFTFNSGTNTLLVTNATIGNALGLTAVPASGTSAQILTRNNATGLIERISPNAIAALPINAVQFRTIAGFGGDANFVFDPTNDNLTLGTRTGATGQNSFTQGQNNRAIALNSAAFGIQTKADGQNAFAVGQLTTATGTSSMASGVLTRAFGPSSHAEGSQTLASANASHAEGQSTIASGNYSHAEGLSNTASGIASHAEGNGVVASGQYAHAEGQNTFSSGNQGHSEGNNTYASGATSHAQNQYTRAAGQSSHAGGQGLFTRPVYAGGIGSFNHSSTDFSQVAGHGALANYSAILGGFNNNIASGNTRAVLLGGTGIKLTGTTYIDHVAVPNLAIMTMPTSGSTTDDMLTWNPLSKKVTRVQQVGAAVHSNTVYVSTLGNNSTGRVNNVNKPFSTLVQALAVANAVAGKTSINRVLIYVLPGQYTLSALFANIAFVDFYFCPGVSITQAAQWNINVDSNIYGYADLYQTTVGSIFGIGAGGSTKVRVEFNNVQNTAGTVSFQIGAVDVHLKVDHVVLGGGGVFTQITALGANNVTIEFDTIANGSSGFQVFDFASGTGNVKIIGNRVDTNTSFMSVAGSLRVDTYVKEINMYGNQITFGLQGTSLLRIHGGRIISATQNVILAPIRYVGGTPVVYLSEDVTIICANLQTASISSSTSGQKLVVYGEAYSNKPVQVANITVAVGTFVTDAVNVVF